MSQDRPNRPSNRRNWPLIVILLALPYIALCFPALYARATPSFFGIPFFYWYQLLCVVATSAILLIVYKQLKTR